MRGNPPARTAPASFSRSIPACAGEPFSLLIESRFKAVYPRVCGGTCPEAVIRSNRMGLSPRVRGNPGLVRAGINNVGSIPACAGEPSQPKCRKSGQRVYPRVCGGTANPLGDANYQKGLSPRVRGNPPDRPTLPCSEGSIPACAGEPVTTSNDLLDDEVYPRVCGGTPEGMP